MKRFWSVFTARNLEFLRDRSALGWNLVWPVLMVLGLAFLFSGEQQDVYKVGVYPANAVSENHEFSFFGTEFVHFIPVEQLDEAIAKVERHRLDMLIDFSNPMRYWINSTSTNGYFLEKLLLASRVQSDSIAELAGAFNVIEIPEKQIVTGSEIRYVDWVLPGVLAVNMMFSCLFGIGYVIVRYRKNRVLRRLKATPLLPFEFLAAQVLSRLLIIMVITVIVYIACDLFIDFYMRGSLLDLFIVFTIGSLSLISMGLLVAARIKSEELSSGILNVISWPMMLLSGVWFSLEGVHPIAQQLSNIFPLTHMIDAARAIMNDGAGLIDVGPQLLILLVMTVVFMLVGSLMFRWE